MEKAVEFSVAEFLRGDADVLWTNSYLDAYKILVDYHISVGELENTVFKFANGTFTDPSNNLVNPWCQPIDLTQEANNPIREFSVADFNASFLPHEEDPRWVMTSFPYTECSAYFLHNLPKKKRTNYRTELARERAISPNMVVEEVSLHDPRWFKVFQERSKVYDFKGDCFVEMFASMDKPWHDYVPGTSNYKVFIVREADEVFGAMVLMRTGKHEGKEIWYSLVFSSLRPCIRTLHLHVVETELHDEAIVHYGASHCFDPNETKAFSYKNAVSNASLSTPYMLAYMPEPAIAPYYCLLQKKWIIEDNADE